MTKTKRLIFWLYLINLILLMGISIYTMIYGFTFLTKIIFITVSLLFALNNFYLFIKPLYKK